MLITLFREQAGFQVQQSAPLRHIALKIRAQGDTMSLTSKIAKSIQSLTNTLHQEPSYSFLAAEERKMMLRQQQGTSMLEPDPSSFGRNKFGS